MITILQNYKHIFKLTAKYNNTYISKTLKIIYCPEEVVKFIEFLNSHFYGFTFEMVYFQLKVMKSCFNF